VNEDERGRSLAQLSLMVSIPLNNGKSRETNGSDQFPVRRDDDIATDHIHAALIAVAPIGVGIKQNEVIMALQAANTIDFAGYAVKFSRGSNPRRRRK
jgi:hypothetical protein